MPTHGRTKKQGPADDANRSGQRFAERTPSCERFPALIGGRECISWENGPRDATLLVVGEAPGAGNPEAEQWRGGNWTELAYTSRHSGWRIRDLLADAGFDGDCDFTNAVVPTDNLPRGGSHLE